MKLASKLFFASSLVIVVLVGVAVLSLRAVNRLVGVNRDITTHTVPALRLAASARDASWALARLEARYLVLRDAQYATLWDERASRAHQDLTALRQFAASGPEAERLADATAAFEEYQGVVAEERALLARGRGEAAIALAEARTYGLIERMESSLEGLVQATNAAAARAQADAAELEARTWTGVLLSLWAAVGLALLGTAVIAHRITRSLRGLSAATSTVAAGCFRDPIPVTGSDEIGDLGRSFNAMAARLRQLDAAKQEFFARISHELRSPLTSVREAAHLLHDEVPGALNPKQARLVAIIAQSSDRLLRLVNQLLDLCRLRAGVVPLACQRVELDRVAWRVLEELRPQADEARVTIDCERQGDDFVVLGDEDRLVQVVVNLVGNAIRFTPPRGRVLVRLVDAGPEVEVRVEDTGVGIPATALDTIFESYQQAHRNRGGTGLGLAIARGIVEAHGGSVSVESQEGKGTRFTVLLPRVRGDE